MTLLIVLALGAAAALLGALYAAARRENSRMAAETAARTQLEAERAAETQRLREQLAAAEQRAAVASEAREAAAADRDRRGEELRALREEHLRTERELAALKAASGSEIAALRRREEELREAAREERERQEARFREQFRNLSTEILGEQSQRFRQSSQESIDLLLKPFRDNIVDFRKRVEEIYSTQTSQRGELKAELRQLMELNRTISADAQNLTNALRGNSKVQGDWGEMLLETILDGSSLIKGIHYETQHNLKDAEGRNLRPDVILHLPEQKCIVIDSKVSLTAYVACTEATDEAERQRLLAAHAASVRQHVRELGAKEYQRLLDSPDFVVMFIPNEPAFLEALKADRDIWADAYERKVLISSPTNLFALLRLVADLWKYSDQDRNTRRIAECGLKIYEQLVAFTKSLEDVGAALGKAQGAYDDAYKRLCRGNDNVVRVGQRLQKIARLQTKRQFPARALEMAGEEPDEEAGDETGTAAENPQG